MSSPASRGAASAPELIERLRAVHLQMLDAVLTGAGLRRVASIASDAIGGPVAMVLPRLNALVFAGSPPRGLDEQGVRRYVAELVKGSQPGVPPGVARHVPIALADEVIGAVLLFTGPGPNAVRDEEAAELLHLAAVASLTEVAVEETRIEVEQNLRGSFIEDLRNRHDLDGPEIVRRAGRLGCDVSRGALVLCAELNADRPMHVVATIGGEYPGALAQHVEGAEGRPARVYAVLPASGGDGAPEHALAAARGLAERLRRHGVVGASSFYSDPAELGRAVQEAELVLDVLRRTDVPVTQDIGTGTYRLLFRVLASHPEEVRSFYEDTVEAIVRYDEQYTTDLLPTLEAYLEHNCNMNATAAAIYAHRHTVAYRLERVKELTGLDPMQSEDRERLGLGLKAYRIIAPRLPR